MDEFAAIARFFTPASSVNAYARLGIGDDCAVLPPVVGEQLISTDLLLAGRHFFPDADPYALGHKALAVNLSDIAAMGGVARWFTLALALPQLDSCWLTRFQQGLFALAQQHHVALIGGDTTRGAVLSICITVGGEAPNGTAVTRAGAQVGDDIWVSGLLGSAALALQQALGNVSLGDALAARTAKQLHQPAPRLLLGQALRGIATAMLDLSDGLAGDLRHLLRQSQVGAVLQATQIPCETWLRTQPQWWSSCVLSGGDDYELCFTAPVHLRTAVLAAAQEAMVAVSRIGTITDQPEQLWLHGLDGMLTLLDVGGFNHFVATAEDA